MQHLGRPSVDAAALQSIWAEQVFAKLAAEEMFAEEMRRRWPAAKLAAKLAEEMRQRWPAQKGRGRRWLAQGLSRVLLPQGPLHNDRLPFL